MQLISEAKDMRSLQRDVRVIHVKEEFQLQETDNLSKEKIILSLRRTNPLVLTHTNKAKSYKIYLVACQDMNLNSKYIECLHHIAILLPL